ncbi:MAG: hypothetical protein LUD72_14640 [Bacteroidales bacterium]|nr:hypothetical protein [Bacteroidales bacterium]
MSDFSLFMKQNKIVKENEFYAPTKSLCDENGEPLKWEFRHISSAENDQIRDECVTDIPVTGKPGVYRPKTNSTKYMRKMIVACTVYPNLYDAGLQDSYGVKNPEDLLVAMVDNPGEYNDLASFIQQMNGFDVSLEDKVDEAKNS